MRRPQPTPPAREAKLFRNNRSQAVRIPAEFALPGDRVRISKIGDKLIIEPVKKDLLAILARLEPIEEPFPDVDDGLQLLRDIEL